MAKANPEAASTRPDSPIPCRPATQCVHAGVEPDPSTGALVPPLVQSTTYAWPDLDEPPRITYARGGNATTEALERRLAALENGADAVAFGSGVAAIDALFRAIPTGGRIVAGTHLYGGTTRLLERFYADRLRIDFVDASDAGHLSSALETPADLVIVETPTNPTLRITDLRLAANLSHEADAILAVDNTFLTPLWQQPLNLGADVVVHSTTKYLDGHNVTLGGALVVPEGHAGEGQDPKGPLSARYRWIRKATGTPLAPFEAWLTLQGTKTLHLRTARQWQNAKHLARAAKDHSAVRAVLWPGFPDHPGHDAHRSQASGDGGIVGLDLGSLEAARRFVRGLQIFRAAENLGATESLVTHPASMSHSDLGAERRHALGIGDGLVRLSLGIEDPLDLEADLRQALDALQTVEVIA